MKQLAIFGFGLVGASLAAAVREANPTTHLVAIDLAAVIASGAARALADELVDTSDQSRVRQVAEAADLCVLAAPVGVIVRQLPALLEYAQVVTDCGSTKRSICAAAADSPRRGRFVPGHPMAGGPLSQRASMLRECAMRAETWRLAPRNAAPHFDPGSNCHQCTARWRARPRALGSIRLSGRARRAC